MSLGEHCWVCCIGMYESTARLPRRPCGLMALATLIFFRCARIKLQTRVPRDYLERSGDLVAEATFAIHSMQTSLCCCPYLCQLFPAISCFPRVVRVKTDPGLSGRNETGKKTLLSQERVDLLDSCPCRGLGHERLGSCLFRLMR